MKTIGKVIVIGGLAAAAAAGFWYVAKKTNGGKGTSPDVVPSVQYAEVTATGATLYDSGAPLVMLGAADKTAAIALVHERMKKDGVSTYFIFMQADDGTWWATGYKDGVSASDDLGPFADQALAMQAGTKWVQAQAVPIPQAAVGAHSPGSGIAKAKKTARRRTP